MSKPGLLKKLSACIFVTFIIVGAAKAQWYDPDKVNKKAANFYETAYNEAVDGKYQASISHLADALKADPKFLDVYLSRAGIYATMKNYQASVADFKHAFELDPVYSNTYLLPYSISLAGIGAFHDALEKVNQFLARPNLSDQSKKAAAYRKTSYEFAIDFERKNPGNGYTFTPVNMGVAINSDALEYFPSLTIDGKTMIYTRRQNNDEDFYESEFQNSAWSAAKPVAGKINTNFNEGAQNISQDGQWLIFTGCNYPEGAGSCDLYIAYKTKSGGWTEPQNLGLNLNSEAWESSPSLSPDKKDLYFSSNRVGGYGGKDIWVSHRSEKGVWSKPENLGPTINTVGDEGCPFIHPDNQTLYFNSSGKPGYGATDLFLSRKNEDGTWNEAQNLGYPVNTIDDEGSLIVSADGKTGYYASDGSDTKGGLDLYSFGLRSEIQAARTLWVKGRVFDKKTNEGIPSSVQLINLKTGKIVSNLQTDDTGNYLVTLPTGKEYALNINRKGYLFYSDNFALERNETDSFFVKNIPLQALEAGAEMVLRNIFFDVNQSTLKNESLIELNKVADLLIDNPTTTILIGGYTDNVGSPAANLTLSQARAKAVLTYLISKGIPAKNLVAKGFGETNPVSTNDTEEGRALNRRTSIRISSL